MRVLFEKMLSMSQRCRHRDPLSGLAGEESQRVRCNNLVRLLGADSKANQTAYGLPGISAVYREPVRHYDRSVPTPRSNQSVPVASVCVLEPYPYVKSRGESNLRVRGLFCLQSTKLLISDSTISQMGDPRAASNTNLLRPTSYF